jgi:hypothetical protein
LLKRESLQVHTLNVAISSLEILYQFAATRGSNPKNFANFMRTERRVAFEYSLPLCCIKEQSEIDKQIVREKEIAEQTCKIEFVETNLRK